MLNFPTPYPNELIYSTIARAGIHHAITSPKQLLEEVFANRKVIATIDLPSHLICLLTHLSDCSCELRDNNSNSSSASVGSKYTYIQNMLVAIKIKQQQGIQHPPINTPSPIADFLDKAPLYEIAVGVGITVVVVGAIVLLPVSATVAGALGGYVLATS